MVVLEQPRGAGVAVRFSGSVIDTAGRIDTEYPATQIVDPIVAWVTAGLLAPGVHPGSDVGYIGSAVGAENDHGRLAQPAGGPVGFAQRAPGGCRG